MECPMNLGAYQIQGLDYEKIFPVIQWLINKLMESRDERGERNKRQGALNYGLMFKKTAEAKEDEKSQDITKLNDIIFKGKPKRVFRSIRNKQVELQDPKRVHSALREFNDMSANKVFSMIIDQISQLENEEK